MIVKGFYKFFVKKTFCYILMLFWIADKLYNKYKISEYLIMDYGIDLYIFIFR